jgi:hypothetical protein
MIALEVAPEHTAEVALVQHHHVVQALSPDGAETWQRSTGTLRCRPCRVRSGIRGAPQVTLAFDILRIKARTLRSTAGLPLRPARLFFDQKRLNPSRCQRMTVAGWTMPSACCQPAHSRQRTLHSPRSQRLRCGRRLPTVRLRTPTWWRRARFSKAGSRCVFKSDRAASRSHHSRLSMAKEVTARRRILQAFRHGPVSGRNLATAYLCR